MNETERMVAAIWKDILQAEVTPARTDNFFALGGDSMAMVLVESRVKEELKVDLPVGALLTAPTLQQLIDLIHSANQAVAESATKRWPGAALPEATAVGSK